MPGIVTPLAVGICGKLPARADFVRSGLPRDFADAWDTWLCGVMSSVREQTGAAWLPAFLQAPVWRFALPAGTCGEGAVLGVMIPSVDRAGRYFPLTLAATGGAGGFAIDPGADAWLNQCEDAGRASLNDDLEPDAIMARIGAPYLGGRDNAISESEWWTDGSPRVAAGRVVLQGLPNAAGYAAMLGLSLFVEPPAEIDQIPNPPE